MEPIREPLISGPDVDPEPIEIQVSSSAVSDLDEHKVLSPSLDDPAARIVESTGNAGANGDADNHQRDDVAVPIAAVAQPGASNDAQLKRRDSMAEREVWLRKAAIAVEFHRKAKQDVFQRDKWEPLTLHFPDKSTELAFQWYFGKVRGQTIRKGLLWVAFFYMLYSIIEWGDQHFFWHLVVARAVYIVLLLGGFALSFVFEDHFHRHISFYTTLMLSFTGMDIIVEGALQRQLYSPFLVIILIMYLVAGPILVRTRFVHTTAVCWASICTFDFFSLIIGPSGDQNIPAGQKWWRWFAWYNFILMFTVIVLMKMTHRVEVAARYEFLTNYRLGLISRAHATGVVVPTESFWDMTALAELNMSDGASPVDIDAASSAPVPSALRRSSAGPAGSPERRAPMSVDNATARTSLLSGMRSEPVPAAGALPSKSPETVVSPTSALKAAPREYSTFSPSALHKDIDEETKQALARQLYQRLKRANGGRGSVPTLLSPGTVPSEAGGAGVTDSGVDGEAGLDSVSTALSILTPIDTISQMFRESGVGNFWSFVNLLTAQEGRDDESGRPDVAKKNVYEASTYLELPDYFAPYPYIYTGYRVNFSWKLCWESMFKMHNETVNIWTEFIPFLVCLVLLFVVMAVDPILVASSGQDRTAVALGLFCVLILRALCSGLAHLLHCQSRRAYVVFWAVDYISICVCVLAMSIVFGRFTFYCLPQQQVFFNISVCGLFLSTIVSVVFVSSAAIRTGSFILFVLFANGVPFVYQLTTRVAGGASEDIPNEYLMWWCLNSALVSMGLLIKATSIPERFFPGKLDNWGASHQWWHLFVTSGNVLTYFAWRTYLDWRHRTPC